MDDAARRAVMAALAVIAMLAGLPAAVARAADATGCVNPTVRVSTADQLQQALDNPAPGTVIAVADGTYAGRFIAHGGATDQPPIRVCAGPAAVLDGGGIDAGYVLHLDGTQNWRINGLTIRNGKKGVMVDAGRFLLLKGITVTGIGEEGIHFRAGTSFSTVWGSTISDTGLLNAQYGEGIYVGSAVNHWCDHSGCGPDRCDGNLLAWNTIRNTAAESVDIKEGTTGGTLSNTIMDGGRLAGADSVLDVKGNQWTIHDNLVTTPPAEPFQVHERVQGWGAGNTFDRNFQAR